MVRGSKFRWMARFSTEFRGRGGRQTDLARWRPKLTWLEYDLDGESAPRTVVTIDVASIQGLLDMEGGEPAVIQRLRDLCARDFHLTEVDGQVALGCGATELDEEAA